MQKPELRKFSLTKRNSLTDEERHAKSQQIARHLEALGLFSEAENILFYYSHNSEVDTLELLKKWKESKNPFLPRLTSENTFTALPFSSFDSLEENTFGIPEPPLTSEIETSLDLIIVPGLAFDREGNRLGMGKGFYDRFLANHKGIPKIALAYSEQILDQLPKEPYDETVDIIITDTEIISVNDANNHEIQLS